MTVHRAKSLLSRISELLLATSLTGTLLLAVLELASYQGISIGFVPGTQA